MPTKTEAIKNFLRASTHADLSDLYNLSMECQVNVAQDGGQLTEGKGYLGRAWRGWTDGLTVWKPFRIPLNAKSDPEYKDAEIKYDLAAHAEGIGMTGWDWQNRLSRWVAFDFDAIVGHSDKHAAKVDDNTLEMIRQQACNIEWVTVRKSTSGKGLHLYVFLEPVHTQNHTEHAALARAILGRMAALTGFDFHSKVDTCGQNMWVWHRKMVGTDGLTVIKQGTKLTEPPANWRDHINVTANKTRKVVPSFVDSGIKENVDIFDEMCGQRPKVELDEDHKKLIKFLNESGAVWWWEQDHHMLIAHTCDLAAAHSKLNMRGVFETHSKHGSPVNCFLFPMRRGSWVVRRYTPGVQEARTWDQDGRGFTRCYLNRDIDLTIAARTKDGIEHPSGGFVFQTAESAMHAAKLIGVAFNMPSALLMRQTKIRQHKDGRLIIEVQKEDRDDAGSMSGWIVEGKAFKRVFNTQVNTPSEPETGNYDDVLRHLVTEAGDDYGWVIKSDGQWKNEPLVHVRAGLESLGINPHDTKMIIGQSVFKCWTLVNRPFQPEYPGDRHWNRNAAQLRYVPTQDKESLLFPTWSKILKHIGRGLEPALAENGWAKANGIRTGEDYLRCWIASLLKEPLDPLPYLFLYGPQNSGKSIFHEALSLLFTRGVQRADFALMNQQGFNGELETAVLCIIEETDLRRNVQAYNRIKDWVTSKQLPIHRKTETPYMIPNTTHWVQCANDYNACPVFSGDSRITMTMVDSLDPLELIPKRQLLSELQKEAPDFLASVLSLELPPSNDRLNVPVINTEDKKMLEDINQSPLESFIAETCHYVPGELIKFSDFYEKFQQQLDPGLSSFWSKQRVGREIKPPFVKGRLASAASQFYIGNISWKPREASKQYTVRYILKDSNIVMVPNQE